MTTDLNPSSPTACRSSATATSGVTIGMMAPTVNLSAYGAKRPANQVLTALATGPASSGSSISMSPNVVDG